MFLHRDQLIVLTLCLVWLLTPGCSGLALNPVHMGKFTFQGKVVDEDGNPVPNAWVKVRGWETLTDAQGRWKQEQVVDCGAMREHPTSYDESNEILVAADGYEPATRSFVVKHPSYFGSCEPEETVAFDITLKASKTAQPEKHADKPLDIPTDKPAIPLPSAIQKSPTEITL